VISQTWEATAATRMKIDPCCQLQIVVYKKDHWADSDA